MTADAPRERLYEVFADVDAGAAEKVQRALDVGTDYLDLPIGFCTRIRADRQEIVHATGDHDLIRPGESCPLGEAYCRRTIELDSPLTVQDAAVSPDVDDSALQTFGLGAYVGTKVTVDGDLYGTVCFADREQRDRPFAEAEELFVELLARLVSNELEREAYERDLQARNERLQREKQRFEGIAETSFDVLFRVDRDAEFTYVSSAVERVLAYSPADLVGESFGEFMTDSAAEQAAAAYSRLLDGHPVQNLELEFLDSDGDVVVLAVNATPVEEDGDVVGVQGVGRDVTERKERERELRMKTRAIDAAAVGVSIADVARPDDPLVYVNDGFERVTGYDAEDALGGNCRFLQGDRTDPDATERMRDAIEAGESVTVELVNYRRDGTPFWNRVQLNPVRDDDGALTHYLGFQNDVTERKRTEQLVRLLNRVLRHNLRNQMTTLLGWTDVLQRGEADDAAALAARIEDAGRSLVELSEHASELEQYSRRDRKPARLDPDSLLAAVADDHRGRFPAATIDVAADAERDVCAGEELERAVEELVQNAVKHNPAPEQRVSLSATDDGDWVELVVADDGPGIPTMEGDVVASGEETQLEHASGLGLWLVNWIVTRYGGSFQITGDDDDGTTATLRLPAIDDDTSVDAAARRPTVLFY